MSMVAAPIIWGLTRKELVYSVAAFFLAVGGIQTLVSYYFAQAGIHLRLLTGISFTGWLRWPFRYLELAREYGWPRWLVPVYCICLLGFCLFGYLLVHSAPPR